MLHPCHKLERITISEKGVAKQVNPCGQIRQMSKDQNIASIQKSSFTVFITLDPIENDQQSDYNNIELVMPFLDQQLLKSWVDYDKWKEDIAVAEHYSQSIARLILKSFLNTGNRQLLGYQQQTQYGSMWCGQIQ